MRILIGSRSVVATILVKFYVLKTAERKENKDVR